MINSDSLTDSLSGREPDILLELKALGQHSPGILSLFTAAPTSSSLFSPHHQPVEQCDAPRE